MFNCSVDDEGLVPIDINLAIQTSIIHEANTALILAQVTKFHALQWTKKKSNFHPRFLAERKVKPPSYENEHQENDAISDEFGYEQRVHVNEWVNVLDS